MARSSAERVGRTEVVSNSIVAVLRDLAVCIGHCRFAPERVIPVLRRVATWICMTRRPTHAVIDPGGDSAERIHVANHITILIIGVSRRVSARISHRHHQALRVVSKRRQLTEGIGHAR